MQVGQYLLDALRVFNAGNHFDGAAAFTARLDVDIENPLQSLGPGHRGTAFGGRLVLCLIRRFDLVAFAPLCRGHLHTMRAVRCEHTVKAGEVNPRFGHQGGQFGDEVQGAISFFWTLDKNPETL